MIDVLFVCTGNSCRSPMAEGYFRHLCRQELPEQVRVRSCGTMALINEPASPYGVQALEEEGADLEGFYGRQINDELIEEADYVVAMARNHEEFIVRQWPAARRKTFLLLSLLGRDDDMWDPLGGTEDDYRNCLNEMKPALRALLSVVRPAARRQATS